MGDFRALQISRASVRCLRTRDYPVVSDRDEQHEHSVHDLKIIQEIYRLLPDRKRFAAIWLRMICLFRKKPLCL